MLVYISHFLLYLNARGKIVVVSDQQNSLFTKRPASASESAHFSRKAYYYMN